MHASYKSGLDRWEAWEREANGSCSKPKKAAIMHILQQAKAAQLELWNWNDEDSLARLREDLNYKGH